MYKIRIYAIFAFCCILQLSGGCIRDNRIYVPEDEPGKQISNEMRFGVSSLQSRVATIYNVDDVETLGVFGYSTGADDFDPANPDHIPNLFWNRKVTKTAEGEWTYTPVAYWPVDMALKNSFFAYSPHSSEFTADNYVIVSEPGASGNPTLQYTIPSENIENMFDILYAAPRFNKNRLSAGVNDGKVEYDMRHAMSGIAFLVTGVDIEESEDDEYHLNWLAFMADRMPLTATLDLGYVPVPFPAAPADYDHTADYYGNGAWSEPQAYGSVYYELVNYEEDASGEVHDHGISVKPGELTYPAGGDNILLFFPKDITKSTRATVDLTFIYNDVEYYYYVDMPATYMYAGLVTVFVVTLSMDGVTLQFKETNRIEEWVKGNPGAAEEVEMF